MRKVVIIGGGLAGLISSIQLVRAGISCAVIEKKSYPFHRVCGEYVSKEAIPFLRKSGLYPEKLDLPQIKFLEVSAVNGSAFRTELDLGGFGISRFSFDAFLYRKAKEEGVEFLLDTEVFAVDYDHNIFTVHFPTGHLLADVVIGAFGKRSRVDIQQGREFIQRRSPFVGVKYHVRSNHPRELISLHNFQGGYCGVCCVDQELTNICYLSNRENLRRHGTIEAMEQMVLFKNPSIQNIFQESTFLWKKPEVINEISFETKQPVENHILMAGDAAGMIAPLCGNGMAIAIRSAAMLSEPVIAFAKGNTDRNEMERSYRERWAEAFRFRLWFGRNVQRLFGHPGASSLAVRLSVASPSLARRIVAATHGTPF